MLGAVHYGRNGHHVASLMHVDHTLPIWAFFDVYGSVQKIKLLGEINTCECGEYMSVLLCYKVWCDPVGVESAV